MKNFKVRPLRSDLSGRTFWVVFMVVLICGWFCRCLIFSDARAYGARVTHMALTQKSADFYNRFYHNGIPQEYLQEIITGAINEDTPPRWINHFYDPTTEKGWTGERMGQMPAEVIRQLALLGLSSEQAVSSLEWAHNQVLQDKYAAYEGNRAFGKAVYDYVVKNDKKSAYRSLGHLLHLIQDLTVPAHTRQDTHFEALGDPGEPYEKWADEHSDLSRLTDNTLARSDFKCASLDDCFKKVAQYSNENFFSEGTIFDTSYNKISFNWIKEGKYWYGIKNDIYLLKAEKDNDGNLINITLKDNQIHQSYWNHLSERAVLSSVEVIRLFHEYVARAQKDPSLIEKPPVPSSAFFFKVMMTGLPGILAPAAEPPIFSLYGGLVQIGKMATSIFNEIMSPFRQNQESFQANMVSLSPTEVESAASVPSNAIKPALPTNEITKKQTLPTSDETGLPLPAVLENTPVVSAEANSANTPVATQASQQMPTTPPSGFNFFISGGTPPAVGPAVTEPAPEPKPEETSTEEVFIPAPHIITNDGQIFGLTDDMATSSDGVQIDLTGTSTPDLPVFISVSSSSTVQDYLTLASATSYWHQFVTLNEGPNVVTVQARDDNHHESEQVVVTLFLNTSVPELPLPELPLSEEANLVISELAAAGPRGAQDEFIELYNPSDHVINLTNWSLQYASAQATTTWKYKYFLVNGQATTSLPDVNLPAHSYYLITSATDSSGYSYGTPADLIVVTLESKPTSLGLAGEGGKVRLLDNNHSVVDLIAWGSDSLGAESDPVNITGFSWNKGSLERKTIEDSTAELLAVNGGQHWQGNGWDTDNNAEDFVLQSQPNPQNMLSLTEPRDNLPVLADSAWPMSNRDLFRTSKSPYINNANGSPTSTPKWTAALEGATFSTPVIGLDDSIYIGSSNGKLYKVSSNGAVNLFYNTGSSGTVLPPVIASDGTIYFSDSYKIYALTSDGKLKWAYGTHESMPTLGPNGTIYVGGSLYLSALTPNGELMWQSTDCDSGGYEIKGATIDHQGYVYIVARPGFNPRVCKLNPDTGAVINLADTSLRWPLSNSPFSLDYSGNLYVVTYGGIGIYNSNDFSEKGFVNTDNHVPTSGTPAIDETNAVIYTAVEFGQIDKIDLKTLKKISSGNWPINLSKVHYPGNIIIGADGVFYLGDDLGRFYAFDPDGSLKWLAELDSGVDISSSPVMAADGTLYVVSKKGTLYAF